jgi:hypothetical protein
VDVNADNDLSKEDDVKLMRARNWAFVAMLLAAVVAFGTNAHVKAARAPEEAHFDCPWDSMYLVYRCEQTGGDPVLCPTTSEGADAMCNDACSQNSKATPGIMPGSLGSCSDGPPMRFPCICGVGNAG